MFTRNYCHRHEISATIINSVFYSFTKMLEYFIIDFILFSYVNQFIENNSHIWQHLKLRLAILRFGLLGTSSLALSESASSPSGPSQLCHSLPQSSGDKGQVSPGSFTLQPQPASLQGTTSSFSAAPSSFLADPAFRVGPSLLGSSQHSDDTLLFYRLVVIRHICVFRFRFIVGFKSMSDILK